MTAHARLRDVHASAGPWWGIGALLGWSLLLAAAVALLFFRVNAWPAWLDRIAVCGMILGSTLVVINELARRP